VSLAQNVQDEVFKQMEADNFMQVVAAGVTFFWVCLSEVTC